NRIMMGINNSTVDLHMKNLFGEERHDEMKAVAKSLNGHPELKEAYIVEQISQALSDNQKNLVLPFKFINEEKDITSHYIIFVSKHPLGYGIMKDIMAKESSLIEDGVASFSYVPVKHLPKYENVQLSILD